MRTHVKKGSNARSYGAKFRAWLHTGAARCLIIFIVGCILLSAVMCVFCTPKRYNLKPGMVSAYTIKATKEVVDEITTEQNRKAEEAKVAPVYKGIDASMTQRALEALDLIFEEISNVQKYGSTLAEEKGLSEGETLEPDAPDITYAKSLFSAFTLTDEQTVLLMRSRAEDIESMHKTTLRIVRSQMNAGIKEGRTSEPISNILQAIRQFFELEKRDTALTQKILPQILRVVVQANDLIDEEATALKKQEARDAVPSVIFEQNRNIVVEGELVTKSQYEVLKSLGLLKDNQFDWMTYCGAILLTIISFVLLILLLRVMEPEVLRDTRKTSVVVIVQVLSIVVSGVAVKLGNTFITPMTFCSMLLVTLLDAKVGIASTVSTAVLLSGLTAGESTTQNALMIYMLLMTLLGGTGSVIFLNKSPQRIRLMFCGIIVGMINALVITMLAMLNALDINGAVWPNAGYAMVGGIAAGLIAVGFQPVFESLFNLATPSKLLELSNPNHPLLKKLLMEAPGTYHHSIVVANLAEAAADSVGANSLLARTGAYFHDIGKLKRPQYFKENQTEANPLDMTDPYVAAAIVTSHTKDGLQLAQKYHLPPEIQQIIIEHHGDTPVMFFYHKAVQMANGSTVDIADFRYAGPRPSGKEAAIVMMADTVEAAVRSIQEPTPQMIRERIEQLVKGKLDDGQLSMCPLSLHDIDLICEAFCKVLNGVFHERIEYPKTDIPQRGAFMSTAEEDERENSSEEKEDTYEKEGKEEGKQRDGLSDVMTAETTDPIEQPEKSLEAEPEHETDLGLSD